MRAKNWLRLLLVCAGCLPAAPAFGQAKVGVINVQKAVAETAEIKKASADLEAKYRPRQEEMAKLQADLQGIQQKLGTPDISPQAQAELNAQGQRKQRDLQRLQEDLQGDVDRERGEILGRTGQRMREVISKLAEAKGLELVFDAGSTLYVKPAMDLTNDAIAEYNKAYPVK